MQISEMLPQTEILAQLAEECSEMAHAALKLRRAYDGTNPTPVSIESALHNLAEEVGDVNAVLSQVIGIDVREAMRITDQKLARWAYRLEAARADDDD